MASENALDIAGLVLAAPPILEPTLHCVKYILGVTHTYQNADQLHQENLLQLETHLYQVQQFTGFLQENFQHLDDDTRSLCKRLIAVLEARLMDLVSVFSSITDPSGKAFKIDYAVKGRNAISQLCSQLEAWEGSLNSVLFAYTLSSRQRPPSLQPGASSSLQRGHTRWERTAELLRRCLDIESSASLQLPPETVDERSFTPVPFSSVRWRNYPSHCLLESHNSTGIDKDVKDIATFLSKADQSVVNIFRCRGYYGHKLLFELPPLMVEPRSLQSVLIDAYSTRTPSHDLTERLALIKKIASSILFVHTANHIHKSIRTDNILLLSSELPKSLGEPYLVGFDLSRKSEKSSDLTKTTEWWKAYYVAPDRQGDTNRAYTLLDDVYSFGVVLLELSLWESFARWHKSSRPPHEMKWVRGSNMMQEGTRPLLPRNSEQLRQRFIRLARELVPIKMGSAMSRLIVSCLTCVDDDSVFADKSSTNASGSGSLGTRYIKEVILQLEEIQL